MSWQNRFENWITNLVMRAYAVLLPPLVPGNGETKDEETDPDTYGCEGAIGKLPNDDTKDD